MILTLSKLLMVGQRGLVVAGRQLCSMITIAFSRTLVAAIIAATGYATSRAESIMWTAHNTGSAVVCSGTQDFCIKVYRVLRNAGLRATVSEVQK